MRSRGAVADLNPAAALPRARTANGRLAEQQIEVAYRRPCRRLLVIEKSSIEKA